MHSKMSDMTAEQDAALGELSEATSEAIVALKAWRDAKVRETTAKDTAFRLGVLPCEGRVCPGNVVSIATFRARCGRYYCGQVCHEEHC